MNATGSGAQDTDEALRATTAPAQPANGAIASAFRLAARVPRPVRQGLVAFAAYLAVFTAVYGWPLFRQLNTPDLRQYWTDPNFYTWSMRWWPYAVSHGFNPLYSSQIGAPHGYDLAWASTTPSVDLLMWPVTAAFGVLVSYNIVLLLASAGVRLGGLPRGAAADRPVLGRRCWPAPSTASALTSWCTAGRARPNLTAIALFPLLAYLVLRWWDGSLRDRWFVIWAAAAMALEFYTFNEAFFDLTAVLAGGLVIGWAVAGRGGPGPGGPARRADRRRLRGRRRGGGALPVLRAAA